MVLISYEPSRSYLLYPGQNGHNFANNNFRCIFHDDIIKLKHFSRYWPFVQGIHQSLMNFPNKGQWRGALKFSLICAWTNGWVNNRDAGDFLRHRDHYDVTVKKWMKSFFISIKISLPFVPKDAIDDNNNLHNHWKISNDQYTITFDYIMAWCRIGDKPLSEPMPTQFIDRTRERWVKVQRPNGLCKRQHASAKNEIYVTAFATFC